MSSLTQAEARRLLNLGYVYFIVNSSNTAIKIGHAKDVARRFNSIQTSNHERLSVIGYFEGTRHDEAVIHKLLKKFRIDREWYSTNCLSVIVSLIKNPDLSPAGQKSLRGKISRVAHPSLESSGEGVTTDTVSILPPPRRVRQRHNSRVVTNCLYCDKSISSDKRVDSKYCNDSCRYEAWFERHNAT